MTIKTRALSALLLTISILPAMGGIAFAQLSTTDPNVTVEDGGENCNGIIPTPGSENTVKTLTGGDLTPGGFATFQIAYPVDEEDFGDWEIVDCVLIGTGDDLKTYDVLDQKTFSGVINSEFFVLNLHVDIPENTAIGTTICNVAKTTEGPSAPQASNRKAGPACFTVGGAARVEKHDSQGNLLQGATFEISDCINEAADPDTQPIIVDPAPDGGGPEGIVVADEGFISFNGASGSSCVVTEIAAPDGYAMPPEDERSVTVTIPVGQGDQTVIVFVNELIEPGIEVEKLCTTSAGIGDVVTYTITVRNTGNEELENITVVDDLLGDLSSAFDDTLDVGEEQTEEFTRTVLASDPDPLPNTVTASAVGAESGDEVDDEASCSSDVVHEPAIEVTKACTGPVGIGQEVTYTITVTNTGDEPLENVTVIDSLLGDLSASFDDTLGVGEDETEEFTRVVLDTDPDPLPNEVTASATGADSDEDVSDDASCETTILNPAIQIVKDGPALAHVGDTVIYDLTVTNEGDTPLGDIVVSDPLCDAAPEFVDGDENGNDLLDLEESWTYLCAHVVTEGDGDPVPNTATVGGTDETGTEVSDTDDHVVDIIHPAIAITKVSDLEIAAPGQTVTYTLTVTNTGDTELGDVVVSDPLCDTDPVLEGGDTNDDGLLDLTETWTYTCTLVFPAGGLPVDNTATVEGTDVLGETVTDDDSARVLPILAERPELPKTGAGVLPFGTAGLMFMLMGMVMTVASRPRRSPFAVSATAVSIIAQAAHGRRHYRRTAPTLQASRWSRGGRRDRPDGSG